MFVQFEEDSPDSVTNLSTSKQTTKCKGELEEVLQNYFFAAKDCGCKINQLCAVYTAHHQGLPCTGENQCLMLDRMIGSLLNHQYTPSK